MIIQDSNVCGGARALNEPIASATSSAVTAAATEVIAELGVFNIYQIFNTPS